MLNLRPEPIDYPVIGHVTNDRLPDGSTTLGGTAAFASLTIRALGLRPGIVTMLGEETDIGPLESIPIAGDWCPYSTTFENIHGPGGRIQKIHHLAGMVQPHHVPETWRRSPIVHLAPLANEIDLQLLRIFPESRLCLTLQGWLRSWDREGRVFPTEWPEAHFVLRKAAAAVMSIEDVRGDESIVEEFAASSEILVVTEGEKGGRIFTRGEVVRYDTPESFEIDPVGAGDIFAAAFFQRVVHAGDPLEAASFAARLAANSVSRAGLDSVPTAEEIHETLTIVY